MARREIVTACQRLTSAVPYTTATAVFRAYKKQEKGTKINLRTLTGLQLVHCGGISAAKALRKLMAEQEDSKYGRQVGWPILRRINGDGIGFFNPTEGQPGYDPWSYGSEGVSKMGAAVPHCLTKAMVDKYPENPDYWILNESDCDTVRDLGHALWACHVTTTMEGTIAMARSNPRDRISKVILDTWGQPAHTQQECHHLTVTTRVRC